MFGGARGMSFMLIPHADGDGIAGAFFRQPTIISLLPGSAGVPPALTPQPPARPGSRRRSPVEEKGRAGRPRSQVTE
jgi:hypothetical protein